MMIEVKPMAFDTRHSPTRKNIEINSIKNLDEIEASRKSIL